jgi:hypothetical protein
VKVAVLEKGESRVRKEDDEPGTDDFVTMLERIGRLVGRAVIDGNTTEVVLVDVDESAALFRASIVDVVTISVQPTSGASCSSVLQMTSKMGKSFAQLLTKRAVLMAFGLAGEGGGRGSI